jgi:uncharacterized protein involved in response to NO
MASFKLPLAPFWASPFRPFCALGMAYGILLMALWVAAQSETTILPHGTLSPQQWHAHEMMFGFAGAIICATVLTALPGWAHTPEVRGAPLAGLVALWLAGRIAFLGIAWLPPAVVIVANGGLYVALLALFATQLRHVANRYYLLLLPVFAGMLAGDVLFLTGHAETGLMACLYSIVLVYALKGGVLVPVFTGNHLRATGRGGQTPFLLPLEVAAIVAVVALAAADLAGAPPRWRAAAALAAFAVHAVRLLRWRGWKVLDTPLLWTMHIGYAWMVLAFLLLGLSDLGVEGAGRAWLHAFTVGALGSMMLGLMTRVALRHTGRPLVLPSAIVGAYLLMQVAALLRVAGAMAGSTALLVALAGAAWIAAFAIYLACFGSMLLSPSLPRATVNPLTVDAQSLRREAAR